MDVVEFLTARLDEDEQAANFIVNAPGIPAPWWSWETLRPRYFNRADAEHIARHDPARVLREVAAKRAILAEHKHAPATERSTDDFGCEICAYDRGDCVLYGWGWCKTVRLLAAPYADHPDYDESWRLDT